MTSGHRLIAVSMLAIALPCGAAFAQAQDPAGTATRTGVGTQVDQQNRAAEQALDQKAKEAAAKKKAEEEAAKLAKPKTN